MSTYSLKAKNLKFVITILIIDAAIILTILSNDGINTLLVLGDDWLLHIVKSGIILTIAVG